MKKITTPVRVRFAPSPTGQLHIGNLRTAIFNYLFARHYQGVFLLRIEDTDRERSKQEYVDSILESLDWVDIVADEPIIVQSERLAEHKKVIEQLLAEGKAYRCYCTQADLTESNDLFLKYDGRCRSLKEEQPNKPYVVRFKVPDFSEISFDDIIHGRVTIPRDQFDDFIIARSDGSPMYNFVVVVDDAYMGITHVIRGEDHISNTPKQILLYQACGYTIPEFAHIPLILGPSGDRLSKRDGAIAVSTYKELGYLPDAFVNYLVRLGWSHGDQEVFSRQELIDLFSLNAVGKKGAIFDIQKLNWLNGLYIRNSTALSLAQYSIDHLDSTFRSQCVDWHNEQFLHAIDVYKERVVTLKELIQEVILLYQGPSSYDEADTQKWIGPQTNEYLVQVVEALEAVHPFQGEELSNCIKELAKKMRVPFAHLAQPIRIALIGKSKGPGIFDMLTLVGKRESLDRMRTLRDYIEQSR